SRTSPTASRCSRAAACWRKGITKPSRTIPRSAKPIWGSAMLDATRGAPLLVVDGLQAWYGESHILHGATFEVRAGEVVTLLGRNGAGKTTTLKSIMG